MLNITTDLCFSKYNTFIFNHIKHRLFKKFDSAVFGLGRNQLVNMSAYPDIVKAYKQYILQSALLLGAKDDSQTTKDIEDLVAFESKLANV